MAMFTAWPWILKAAFGPGVARTVSSKQLRTVNFLRISPATYFRLLLVGTTIRAAGMLGFCGTRIGINPVRFSLQGLG